MRQAETRRRADAVLAWLEANPHGGSSLQLHAAVLTGRGLATMQKLLRLMVRQGEPIAVLGSGSHMRYAAPRHREAAQKHMDGIVAARATRWSRVYAQRRELEREAAEASMSSGYERGEAPCQRIVREWAKPRKLGPSSVFELA